MAFSILRNALVRVRLRSTEYCCPHQIYSEQSSSSLSFARSTQGQFHFSPLLFPSCRSLSSATNDLVLPTIHVNMPLKGLANKYSPKSQLRHQSSINPSRRAIPNHANLFSESFQQHPLPCSSALPSNGELKQSRKARSFLVRVPSATAALTPEGDRLSLQCVRSTPHVSLTA